MSDEPRRSVRATKGQHKALEQEQVVEAPKRRGRKKKDAPEDRSEEVEEEVIRCVCGATEQDEHSEEPWIACDKCGVWQHNVCMGMSVYSEDLSVDYYCELCKPEDHKELLDGVKHGKKIWEERRQAYEEEQAQKKKRGPKKGKGKRLSGDKDDNSQTNSRAKPSPAPEAKKDTKPPAGLKRKSRAESQDDIEDHTPQKHRKVTESQPVTVQYDPPADLPDHIAELPAGRQPMAKALLKSLSQAMSAAEKQGSSSTSAADDDATLEERAERLAIQIERAVHDTHSNHTKYTSQIRTLIFNLKSNPELYARLASHTLTPPMLAAMTSDEMASKALQREKAEMQARADKQSILITDDGAPRVRRTHKGEEMVGDDGFAIASDETPSVIRRPSVRDPVTNSDSANAVSGAADNESADDYHGKDGLVELPAHIGSSQPQPDTPLRIQTHSQSPKADFDINKVFSSVKSPTTAQHRRPSVVPGQLAGPGVDPEVDRMLQDAGDESPPYSPSEETDPDVVWRGNVVMASIANLYATAKHVGGANLHKTLGLPWQTLLPKRLHVAGRIDVPKAIEYLCSLRYSPVTDVVVVKLTPASETAKTQFRALYDYFTTKKRYGVVGEKGTANVRDTYLVPVAAGTGNYPEFMLNLVDNFIPETRTEPMLLLVVVYRNNPETIDRLRQTSLPDHVLPRTGTQLDSPTPAAPHNRMSVAGSGPAFSPASPQGPFPGAGLTSRGLAAAPGQQQPTGTPVQPRPQSYVPAEDASKAVAQRDGEALAREVLGPFISSPTVQFLIPQAHQMRRREWELIRRIFEQDVRSRVDLPYLGKLLEKESAEPSGAAGPGPSAAAAPAAPGSVPAATGGPPAASAASVPAIPPQRTPIPPPMVPPPQAAHASVRKQTPIPPPPIPPQAAAAPPT